MNATTLIKPEQISSGSAWQGDVAIVGAGIVGLAVAREWLLRNPGCKLIVLEREDRIGQGQTGHNSGVIHSGIYYKPGSLKARACVAGARQMKDYCDEHGIPWKPTGKLIVATEQEEIDRLHNLFERGNANGVAGLELVGPERIREIEPYVSGLEAIWSPETGIVDYRQVAAQYAVDIVNNGGEIRTGSEVFGIENQGKGNLLTTSSGDYEARNVVTCAGIYADRVASLTGASPVPQIVPFRGDYFTLPENRRHLVQTNIYPVPDPAFPFLGVHLTPRMNGEIWMGPNAVLAFSRAGYHLYNVSGRDLLEIARNSGFRKFARKHWRVGVDESLRDVSRRRFLASLQKFIPELELTDLRPGPSGVRAQALSADGELVDDFVFDHDGGILHVRNAPSPAATSSLQIGAMIADELEQMVTR